MRRDLRFIDSSYELGFIQSKYKFQGIVVNIISLMGLIYRLLLFALNSQRTLTLNITAILSIIFLIIQISAMVFVRYKTHLAEKVLTVLITLSLFLSFESYLISKHTWNNVMYLHFGSQTGTLIFCLLVGRVRWTYTMFVLLLNIFGYNIRYIDIQTNKDMNYFPLAATLIFCFSIILSSYYLERTDRNRYKDIKDYDMSMDSFKYFIKELLPSGVMILRNKNILFTNLAMENYLKIEQKAFVLEDTKHIYIEKKGAFNKEEISQKIKSADLKKPIFLFDQSLFDIINDEELNSAVTSKYLQFQGWMKLDSPGKEMEKIFFDIKLGSILWERKPALMILITENPMIMKIKNLKSQALYKDRLLATVSHDLRTPLNGIIGMIEMSKEKETSHEKRKSLQIALRSSKLLLYFVNDILDYSQIIHNSLRLKFNQFSVGPLLKELTKLIKFQAKSKGLKFIFDDRSVNSNSDGLIRSDPNRLKQVVLNLLGNSLKFTSEGFIRISISNVSDFKGNIKRNFPSKIIKNLPEDQNIDRKVVYMIEVEDSGCGIEKENIPRLFRVFGKFEDAKASRLNDTGVGLGLSISQNIIKYLNNHEVGKEINVRSEPGKGSCFYFPLISHPEDKDEIIEVEKEYSSGKITIPEETDAFLKPINSMHLIEPTVIIQRTNLKKIEAATINKPELLNFENLKVLIVDDDQINIMVCSSYLKTLGVRHYQSAFNGLQALDIIEQKAKVGFYFDIMLMDCNMPIMDGYEATRNICQRIKNGIIPAVPIIASTANASPKDYEECFCAGMTEYISKPFTLEQLKNIILKERKRIKGGKK